MAEHTKGRLTYDDGPELIRSEDDDEAIASIMETIEGFADANARRLVAAWNFCEGLDTEWLEANPRPVPLRSPGS